LIDSFDISEKGTHIAIMIYSSIPEVKIKFNTYTGAQLNGVNIKRDIDHFKWQRGRTFIDRALTMANENIFTEEAGMRRNVRKVNNMLSIDKTMSAAPNCFKKHYSIKQFRQK